MKSARLFLILTAAFFMVAAGCSRLPISGPLPDNLAAEKIAGVDEASPFAVSPDGKLLAGQKLTLRLSKREWHSHLAASDFSQGVAKYVTDVVDSTIAQSTLVTSGNVDKARFEIPGAGVYIVEVEGHDRLGRRWRHHRGHPG